jgi:hypothetical protein
VSWSSADGLLNGILCYKDDECTSGYCDGECADLPTISRKAWIIVGIVVGLLVLFVIGFALNQNHLKKPAVTDLHDTAFENPMYQAGGANGGANEAGAAPTNDGETFDDPVEVISPAIRTNPTAAATLLRARRANPPTPGTIIKALHSFTPAAAGQLPMVTDETFEFVSVTAAGPEGWWKVKAGNGAVGDVPANYVALFVAPASTPAAPTPATTSTSVNQQYLEVNQISAADGGGGAQQDYEC